MLAGSEIFSLEMSKTEALTQAGSLAAMLERARSRSCSRGKIENQNMFV